jgi:serine/threonine protein kinase
MLGIARALTRILAGVLDSTGENILCGYHFDLKPANILVEDTDEGINFLISDFGQSMFREIVNGDNTSKVTGVGGSEAYAPPEIDISDSKRNRKYDVWSLGCIILEIASFVVGGCEAVQTLDDIRFSKCPQTGFPDDRFFQRTSDPNVSDYELKPQILDWMNDLPTFQTVHAARTEEFLRRILALVKQMLLVDVAKRLDAKFAYLTFSDILQEFQPPSSSKIESLTRDLDLPPDEVELGPTILAETQPISCSAMGRWYEGKASIVENSRGVLAILTSNRNDLERLNIGARATTTIVPYNIQPSPWVEGIPEHKGTVTLLHDSGHPMPKIFELHMHSLRDTVMIQSVLLGQSIRRLGTNASWSLPLRSASFDSRSTKMKKVVHSSKNINVLATVGRALAVQLWSEESHKDPNAWKFRQRKDSPRTVREYFFQGASPRRIVVYYERSILILRLAKNVRVEKPEQNSKSPSLRIVPTDPAADPTFPASLLVCAPTARSPSIPLDRRKLDAEEERKGFECRSLTLAFQTPDELYAFYKAYRSLKKEWLNEEHDIENFRGKMGEELGWGLN